MLQGLTKPFGSQMAVDQLSLEIPAGRIVGFLGLYGKQTTLKMLTGLRCAMMRPATRSAPLLAFVLRDPCLHQFLDKSNRQWLVRGKVNGAF